MYYILMLEFSTIAVTAFHHSNEQRIILLITALLCRATQATSWTLKTKLIIFLSLIPRVHKKTHFSWVCCKYCGRVSYLRNTELWLWVNKHSSCTLLQLLENEKKQFVQIYRPASQNKYSWTLDYFARRERNFKTWLTSDVLQYEWYVYALTWSQLFSAVY